MTKQFDLEAFKAFVESKPRDEVYDPTRATHCALAQYGLFVLTSWGAERAGAGDAFRAAAFRGPNDDQEDLPEDYFTFGALSDRLNNLTAATSPNAAEGGDSPLVPALTYLNGDEE